MGGSLLGMNSQNWLTSRYHLMEQSGSGRSVVCSQLHLSCTVDPDTTTDGTSTPETRRHPPVGEGAPGVHVKTLWEPWGRSETKYVYSLWSETLTYGGILKKIRDPRGTLKYVRDPQRILKAGRRPQRNPDADLKPQLKKETARLTLRSQSQCKQQVQSLYYDCRTEPHPAAVARGRDPQVRTALCARSPSLRQEPRHQPPTLSYSAPSVEVQKSIH